uniref:Reverse transcriptase domain-containing protein n=1 Tax=Caenorhabditis japonica TaxID=281687 RepID=A0A8R1DTG1_CAEJA
MSSDIEKSIPPNQITRARQRDFTRFVWLKDITKGPINGNFVTYRFTRIPFGMSCSPFLLAASILTYMEKYPAKINKQMENNMYVDNLMFLTNIEEELPEMYLSSKAAAQKWGMNVRQYQSNSQKARQFIPEEDQAPDKPNKILGMIFDATHDTMTIGIPKPPEGKPTKRMLQSFLARIYDPMGVLSPLTVRLKQFLQSLWATKIGWKKTIPKDTIPIWESIKKEFQHTEYTTQRQLTDRYDYESAN